MSQITHAAGSALDFRPLRYFLTVADELHFSRAADALGITQPPLSRAIAKLEDDLGVALLTRTSQRVRLTPAGAELQRWGALALAALDSAAAATVRAARPRRVRILVSPEVDLAAVPSEVECEGQEQLEVEIDIVPNGAHAVESVRSGMADLVFTNAGTKDMGGLRVISLTEERRYVLLHARHRYAERREVDFAELAEDPLPVPRDPGQLIFRYLAGVDDASRQLRGRGVPEPPPLSALPTATTTVFLLRLVQLGKLAIIVPMSTVRRHRTDGIAVVPVTGVSAAHLVVGTRPGLQHPAVEQALRAAIGLRPAQAFSTGADL